jgi:uncharacterized protein YjbI with pentapeptide repeats
MAALGVPSVNGVAAIGPLVMVPIVPGLNLRGAILDGLSLRGANLSKCDLRNCSMKGTDLRGVNLTDALFYSADLVGAILK